MPIKLNRSFWPKTLVKILPSANDPRLVIDGLTEGELFSNSVSSFKFGETFKSTQKARFLKTIEVIKNIAFENEPVVLDIGASDGITSIDIIKNIPFKKYYVTDLNIEVNYKQYNDKIYFFDDGKKCILIASRYFIIYSEYSDSIFPFNKIAGHLFCKLSNSKQVLKKAKLINPLLKQIDGNIEIKKYDIFSPWSGDRPDLIVVANILNRSYFSDQKITLAVKNLFSILNDEGRIVVVDSRKEENSTVFALRKNDIYIEYEVNKGTDIKNIILDTFK